MVAVVIIASILSLGSTGTGGSQIALSGQTCNTFTTESLCENAVFQSISATGSDASLPSCTSICCFDQTRAPGKRCFLNSSAQVGSAAALSCDNDGLREPANGESCDGADLGGQTCALQGFFSGPLNCNPNCSFNQSGCNNCGNNQQNPGEACDGTALPSGSNCSSYPYPINQTVNFGSGTVSCSAGCSAVQLGQCSTCGNGSIQSEQNQYTVGGEECDGANLNGKVCADFGFAGGNLNCKPANDPQYPCRFDFSACSGPVPICGNNLREGTEQCDGPDYALTSGVQAGSCTNYGNPLFSGGTLNCSFCQVDTYTCNYHGNNACNSGTTAQFDTDIGASQFFNECKSTALGGACTSNCLCSNSVCDSTFTENSSNCPQDCAPACTETCSTVAPDEAACGSIPVCGGTTTLNCGDCSQNGEYWSCSPSNICQCEVTDICTNPDFFPGWNGHCGGVYDYACTGEQVPCGCSSGFTCDISNNGNCVPVTGCQDECPVPDIQHCQSNAIEDCGNFDADACLEWGNPQNCGSQTCTIDFGVNASCQ